MLLGYGAGATGLLALLLALLLAGILLTWWSWRYAAARCGRPRPPLSWGGYLLVSALAVYPVACVLMLICIAIQNIKSQRAEEHWNRRSYLTLNEAKPFGEITLPKGSWVNRQEPRQPGTEDSPITMNGVTAVRFPQPHGVAGVRIIAFEVLPPVMEAGERAHLYPPERPNGTLRSGLAGHLLVAAGSAGPAVGGVAGRAACGSVSAQRLDL
ncbi:hypothetical protein ACQFN5_06715 [Klebsiella sp. WOUb02]|uniref:hypothetical protein n=1 Tax=Klebsiella sp. WOUb02 TaxID=3161071 RepID=UPI003CFB4E0D